MTPSRYWGPVLAVAVLLAGRPGNAAAQTAPGLKIPYEYYTLPNGLRVVLSQDTTAPTAGVGVYYHIGFRNEPRDRPASPTCLSI